MKDFATMFAAALGLIASPFVLFGMGRGLYLAMSAWAAALGMPPSVDPIDGFDLIALVAVLVVLGVVALVVWGVHEIGVDRGWWRT